MFVNVFLWGVVVSCTAAANNFSSLLALRFFLGIFEATVGMVHSCTLYSSPNIACSTVLHYYYTNGEGSPDTVLLSRNSFQGQWWRRREQTMRLGIWFAANSATGMVSATAQFSIVLRCSLMCLKVGSLISWGIGHIHSDKLFPWQVC